MTPMTLPLVDIYPLVYKPFDAFDVVGGSPMRLPLHSDLGIGFVIDDPLDHAHRAVNLHNNLLPSLMEEKLSVLRSFKAARTEMPRLQDIPAIHEYRNAYPDYDAAKVDTEMAKYGRPLHPGQVLFHGGEYPRDSTGAPLTRFTSSKVLSTSLCAQIAATHSSYHTQKDVWVVRIMSMSTQAIVFGHRGQKLGHEMEVLLAKNVQFTLRRTHSSGEYSDGVYTLFEVDAF